MNLGINKIVSVVVLAVTVAFPAPALSVAYYPLYHLQEGDETAAPAGREIYLFFSGTEEERRILHEGIFWLSPASTCPVMPRQSERSGCCTSSARPI